MANMNDLMADYEAELKATADKEMAAERAAYEALSPEEKAALAAASDAKWAAWADAIEAAEANQADDEDEDEDDESDEEFD